MNKKSERWKRGKNKKQFLTRDSLAVTYRSTSRAQRCLTAQIGRDGVLLPWYEGIMSVPVRTLIISTFSTPANLPQPTRQPSPLPTCPPTCLPAWLPTWHALRLPAMQPACHTVYQLVHPPACPPDPINCRLAKFQNINRLAPMQAATGAHIPTQAPPKISLNNRSDVLSFNLSCWGVFEPAKLANYHKPASMEKSF